MATNLNNWNDTFSRGLIGDHRVAFIDSWQNLGDAISWFGTGGKPGAGMITALFGDSLNSWWEYNYRLTADYLVTFDC